MIPKLNHVGLLISDLEKARFFYGDILGLIEIERPPFLIKGIWYDLGTFQLHLMQYEKQKPIHFHPLNETVQPHLALSFPQSEVTNILLKLKKSQIELIKLPMAAPTGEFQAFFYDFDNNMIEINASDSI
jgi:glyoxylase I family protein